MSAVIRPVYVFRLAECTSVCTVIALNCVYWNIGLEYYRGIISPKRDLIAFILMQENLASWIYHVGVQ